jgi:predicted transcriptional regulator
MRDKILSLINSGEFNANEVATKTGIPTTTVYRIFNGEANLDNVTLKNAEKLAAFWEQNKSRSFLYIQQTVAEQLYDEKSEIYSLAAKLFNTYDEKLLTSKLAKQYYVALSNNETTVNLADYLSETMYNK